MAELMNRIEATAAGSILEAIEREEPKLAVGIRNLMFTFEDILGLPEASLREFVGAADKKTLACTKGRQRRTQEPHLPRHVVTRCRNVERRYGSSRSSAGQGSRKSPGRSGGGRAETGIRGQTGCSRWKATMSTSYKSLFPPAAAPDPVEPFVTPKPRTDRPARIANMKMAIPPAMTSPSFC